MARTLFITFATAMLAAPSIASAFWCAGACTDCGDACCQQSASPMSMEGYCRMIVGINERWPSPYVCPDRVNAHAPFEMMVSNGWRRQNLMGSHHFSSDSTQLTQAGELKVQWIMTQAPEAYRRMFVERSVDPAVTEQRIATVREYSVKLAQGGAAPQVSDTHIVSEGRPAATVDFVNTQFRENMRTPVLPEGGLGGGDE
ncbi:MAG: hypothetical protein KDA37_16745 [Planctomycetales bacterium]|nr:hypothetical protein [Planctomycetales bacterium]